MILDQNQVLLGTNKEVVMSIEVSPSILVPSYSWHAVGVSLPQWDAPYLTTIPGINCRQWPLHVYYSMSQQIMRPPLTV